VTETTRKGAVQRAVEWLLGDTEPVRRALYPVIVPAVALLVGYGVLAERHGALWIALGVAILGPGATEAARAVAWSPNTVNNYGAGWERHAETEFARGVSSALERTPDGVAQEIIDDDPGEHATDRFATSRATRCREVENGVRCSLLRDHGGPHMIA